MKALLILPDPIPPAIQLRRVLASIRHKTGKDSQITLAAQNAEGVTALTGMGLEVTACRVWSVPEGAGCKLLIYTDKVPKRIKAQVLQQAERQAADVVEYPLLPGELFHPPHNRRGPPMGANVPRHIFETSANPKDNQFSFFPYQYIFRCTGMGPTDEFNLRRPPESEHLLERGPEHVVIAVFGGSAAWSMYALYEEMFSQLLEGKLNRRAAACGLKRTFHVLNFAQQGNVVINEMLNFLLMASRWRPEVVIAHDGFNDLVYGQISDRFLLNTWQLTYQSNLESWPALLHPLPGTTGRSVQAAGNCDVRNYPRAILQAYLERVKQFETVCTSQGVRHFILGLQPTILSKKEMSDLEKVRTERHLDTSTDKMAPAYKNTTFLYEKLVPLMRQRFSRIVDWPALFSAYGRESSLFGDVMHTAPAGDEIIAEGYAAYVERELFPLFAKETGR